MRMKREKCSLLGKRSNVWGNWKMQWALWGKPAERKKMVIGGDSMGKQDAEFKEHRRINGFVAAVCKSNDVRRSYWG